MITCECSNVSQFLRYIAYAIESEQNNVNFIYRTHNDHEIMSIFRFIFETPNFFSMFALVVCTNYLDHFMTDITFKCYCK